jgi:hypothetical protein
MTCTISWALFALVLIVIGIIRKLPAARYAALGVVRDVVKLFFGPREPDQLYRIGAFIGVAVIAMLASFAYQRFFTASLKEKNQKMKRLNNESLLSGGGGPREPQLTTISLDTSPPKLPSAEPKPCCPARLHYGAGLEFFLHAATLPSDWQHEQSSSCANRPHQIEFAGRNTRCRAADRKTCACSTTWEMKLYLIERPVPTRSWSKASNRFRSRCNRAARSSRLKLD